MEPETTVIITVNGRHSKRIDSVFTIRNTGEGLILLTELPLEQYLAGVLAGEMGSAPFQTLKAQAVACRTFTLKKIEESEGKPRVFLDSTLDQHYAGYFGPESVFFKAVAETRGEVLICRGRLLESLYHSTCGGHTAKPVYVFENHISGLSAVKDTLSGEKTALCSKSPHFRWEYRLKNSVLDKILIKEAIGNRLGRVENLSVTKYEPDGRALNMEISGSDGRYRMRAYHFWQMVGDHIGWGKIRSTFFRVKKSRELQSYSNFSVIIFWICFITQIVLANMDIKVLPVDAQDRISNLKLILLLGISGSVGSALWLRSRAIAMKEENRKQMGK